MRQFKFVIGAVVVALGTVGGSLSPAFAGQASPAQTPLAVQGGGTNPAQSCSGLLVAFFNHRSTSPSGNPTASVGPGVVQRTETAAAIAEARSLFC